MPHFAIIGRDGPRGAELRTQHREAHLAGIGVRHRIGLAAAHAERGAPDLDERRGVGPREAADGGERRIDQAGRRRHAREGHVLPARGARREPLERARRDSIGEPPPHVDPEALVQAIAGGPVVRNALELVQEPGDLARGRASPVWRFGGRLVRLAA